MFDFDGLILDTEVPEFVTVREEFVAHGIELRVEDWLQIIGRADHRHWLDWLEDEVGAPIERSVVQERRRVKHHALIMENEIRPGIVALLDEADRRGIPAAVASSSTASWVEGHLERLGVHRRFAAIRTRDDVERAKPWPDLFLAATAAVDADPAWSVAFEDSHNGAVAALAAGMFCVVAPNDLTRLSDLSHAHLLVDSLEDVDLATIDPLLPTTPTPPTPRN